jgi:hypothetical protein
VRSGAALADASLRKYAWPLWKGLSSNIRPKIFRMVITLLYVLYHKYEKALTNIINYPYKKFQFYRAVACRENPCFLNLCLSGKK